VDQSAALLDGIAVLLAVLTLPPISATPKATTKKADHARIAG